MNEIAVIVKITLGTLTDRVLTTVFILVIDDSFIIWVEQFE